MTSALIVISDPVASELFCTRTLVERHELQLRRAGIRDVHVLPSPDLDAHLAASGTDDRILIVAAERIFDPRLYAALLASDRAVELTDVDQPIGLTRRGARERPGPALDIRSLDSYSRELRRRLPLYWMRVAGPGDRPAVTRMLVEASGKGHQDLPAMVINAPLEKAAMRRLANTRITPNQITVVCNLLAYGVALLLATGQLLAGAVGAIVVGVVDGLDGRQARIQLRTSAVGRLEHLLDKVYEVLWMVALTYALSNHFVDRSHVGALIIWFVAYLADSAAYDLVKWRTGATLDEASRLDAMIRLVAGRRNVYSCILLAGVLAGSPDLAFYTIVWWSAATAIVHLVRAALVISSNRSRVLV
jgi:phosphatidylglycerophosphate synthase